MRAILKGVRNLMRAVRTHQQMKGKLLGTLAELIEVPEQARGGH